jgi:hypothetical protein
VFIKVESLDEAVSALQTSLQPIIDALNEPGDGGGEHPWLAEVIYKYFDGMVTEMARFQKEDRRALSAVKKYMFLKPDNEIYAPVYARIARPAAKTLEELKMKLLKFKKEQTLYEISTFEEIQLYSVSRLRESEDEHITGFVGYLDRAGSKITAKLGEYGITPIRPRIGEAFNGREHEVLMAEQNDDFKKGEIIKLLNNGYKQGDLVLLRSNVVAAR